MADKNFEFEPRFALVMANLKTVREIREVIKTEGERNFKNFLKHIQKTLNNDLPQLQSWISKPENNNYLNTIYYLDHWKVWEDEPIYIYLAISRNAEKLFYDDDPEVGLYVPPDWPDRKKYIIKLNEELPKSFINTWKESESSDNFDDSPYLQLINIKDYAKGEIFDMNGFVDEVKKLVSELLEQKEIIDKAINQIQK